MVEPQTVITITRRYQDRRVLHLITVDHYLPTGAVHGIRRQVHDGLTTLGPGFEIREQIHDCFIALGASPQRPDLPS